MKILVTGGAGFIGSNLVDALIEKGHEVSVVDNLATGRRENVNEKAKFFEVDITDKDALSKVFSEINPETIFHLAAQISVEVSQKDPASDVRTNVIGTINLLEQAREHKVKKFVFSSTGGAIYGEDAPRPTSEEATPDPATPYGIDKLCAEKFIKFFSKLDGFSYTILRFSNVYGPRQNPDGEAGVVAIFSSKMLKNEPSKIYGDGTQTRDYVYVGDIVDALMLGINSEKSGIYNIATGIETPVNDLTEKLIKLTQTKTPPEHAPARFEQHASSLSFDKAKTELGWEPKVTLKDGLQKTIEWFIDNSKGKN